MYIVWYDSACQTREGSFLVCAPTNPVGLVFCSLALEVGIFGSHIIWLLRTRNSRKEAKLAGETFDQYTAHHVAAAEARAGPVDSSVILASRREGVVDVEMGQAK